MIEFFIILYQVSSIVMAFWNNALQQIFLEAGRPLDCVLEGKSSPTAASSPSLLSFHNFPRTTRSFFLLLQPQLSNIPSHSSPTRPPPLNTTYLASQASSFGPEIPRSTSPRRLQRLTHSHPSLAPFPVALLTSRSIYQVSTLTFFHPHASLCSCLSC